MSGTSPLSCRTGRWKSSTRSTWIRAIPKVTRIVYDNNQITLYFIDGTTKTSTFPSPEFNL